ncbi:MAG: YhcH/YjgK/YiaL family protein [Lachnospiraceae bacterium]
MIYGKQRDALQYLGIGDNLDFALKYVEKQDFSGLVPGKNTLSGEDVYVNCFSYETMESDQAFFEAHTDYLDLHVVLEGEERIEVAHRDVLEEFERDPAADYTGYKGQAEAVCVMRPGDFMIVFPEDAHKVKVKNDAVCLVKKAVFKVKIG